MQRDSNESVTVKNVRNTVDALHLDEKRRESRIKEFLNHELDAKQLIILNVRPFYTSANHCFVFFCYKIQIFKLRVNFVS